MHSINPGEIQRVFETAVLQKWNLSKAWYDQLDSAATAFHKDSGFSSKLPSPFRQSEILSSCSFAAYIHRLSSLLFFTILHEITYIEIASSWCLWCGKHSNGVRPSRCCLCMLLALFNCHCDTNWGWHRARGLACPNYPVPDVPSLLQYEPGSRRRHIYGNRDWKPRRRAWWSQR